MSGKKERLARLEEQSKCLDRVLSEREKQVSLALSAAEKATTKAEHAQERVNITQNEFRGALKDQAAALATQTDVERVVERVLALEKAGAASVGRDKGGETLRTIVMLIVGAAIAYIATRLGR